MNGRLIHVRELAGWGLDDYQHRPSISDFTKISAATHRIAQRQPFRQSNILLNQETAELRDFLLPQQERLDLRAEMAGLAWSLGVVDLRSLIAFQRRLFFNPAFAPIPPTKADDWPALIALAFGPAKPVACDLVRDAADNTMVLRSDNPNLHFRMSNDVCVPLSVHAGSPFFEVACFRGRWFLRDGYHRAYTLLQAGIFAIPAVIVQARTIEELGATEPWFFPEEVLFSDAPPMVVDFQEHDLVVEYDRPHMVKTLRITMEETLTLVALTGDQS